MAYSNRNHTGLRLKTKSLQNQKNVSHQAQTASWRITRWVVVSKVSTYRPGNQCTIWSIPAVPPHVIKRYFYLLCISNTEPKISNGLTNMSFHHELKMGHNCPVFSLHISGAQLPCLSNYVSLTNETIGDDTETYVVPSWIISFSSSVLTTLYSCIKLRVFTYFGQKQFSSGWKYAFFVA